MTGDGVNDIPALRASDCSIAIAEGADAARHAAQITLLESDFGVVPEIVGEGRRIINNITRSATLFLTKTIFSFLLSILLLVFPGAYPFQPIQLTLISSLMVGIPGFFLALEPCEERIRGKFLQTVLSRALPGGIAITVCAALAMNLTLFGWERDLCSTLSTLIAGSISYLVLFHACRPLNGHRKILLALIAAAFAGAVLTLRHIFFLTVLTGPAWIAYGCLTALGCAVLWILYRRNFRLSFL
jgi:cation-transporting ATPase E